MEVKHGAIAIIGAGSVGATLAYNLSLKGVVTEIRLIDTNTEKAEAAPRRSWTSRFPRTRRQSWRHPRGLSRIT